MSRQGDAEDALPALTYAPNGGNRGIEEGKRGLPLAVQIATLEHPLADVEPQRIVLALSGSKQLGNDGKSREHRAGKGKQRKRCTTRERRPCSLHAARQAAP